MPKVTPPTEAQQRRIREKLATGQLPQVLAAARLVPPAEPVPWMTGRLRVAPCDACDEVGMTRPIGGLLWHEACFIFWQATVAAPDT